MKQIIRFAIIVLLASFLLPCLAVAKCDKPGAIAIIHYMKGLTDKVPNVYMEGRTTTKYYVDSKFWNSLPKDKKLALITAVADAHACLEESIGIIQLIDDQTGLVIAEAHPTRGIRVLR